MEATYILPRFLAMEFANMAEQVPGTIEGRRGLDHCRDCCRICPTQRSRKGRTSRFDPARSRLSYRPCRGVFSSRGCGPDACGTDQEIRYTRVHHLLRGWKEVQIAEAAHRKCPQPNSPAIPREVGLALRLSHGRLGLRGNSFSVGKKPWARTIEEGQTGSGDQPGDDLRS